MAFWKKVVVGALFLSAAFVWYAVFQESDNYLKVHFLDVGQGDAAFIETPGGVQLLIDGGPGRRVLSELGRIMPGYDKSIDVVLATHTDFDHIGGLLEVLEHYDVDTILVNGFEAETEAYRRLMEIVHNRAITRVNVMAGDRILFGDGVYFEVLGPFEEDLQSLPGGANDVMIVGKLSHGDNDFLFAGDLERGDELRLVGTGYNLESEVLKVAHHGSRTSSTRLFLDKVSPIYTVVSAGISNRYGHPHIETLTRLADLGAIVYRTDRDSRTTFISNGSELRVE